MVQCPLFWQASPKAALRSSGWSSKVRDEHIDQTVRALARGLQVLKMLNDHNGATVAEIVRRTRLPRTTVLRSLETLAVEGYVVRDPDDDRFRLTVLTRGLSQGFEDEAWIGEIARPLLGRLSRELVWPLSIETIQGMSMVIRENTDRQSPLALQCLPAGFKFTIAGSAGGRAILAFSSPQLRNAVLSNSLKGPEADQRAMDGILSMVAADGYVAVEGLLPKEGALSVPILSGGEAFAALTLRFIASALTPEEAVDRYAARLAEAATEIATRRAALR